MKDAARLVYTLTPMTEDEAKPFALSEADRRFLIRMDSGKVNIAPPSTKATWFRLVGIPLGNANDLYKAGDDVQTVEPWQPPDTWVGLDSPPAQPHPRPDRPRDGRRPAILCRPAAADAPPGRS